MSITSTRAHRSAGSMKAVPAPKPRSLGSKIFWLLRLTLLMLIVTSIGIVGGAFIMSPAVTMQQRMLAGASLGALAVLGALGYLLTKIISRLRLVIQHRRQRAQRAQLATAGLSVSPRPRVSAKTPHTVQALAASGAAPTEIAWKTGLPVDAVAMLLEITGPVVAAR